MDHNYIDHDCIGHVYIGHDCIDHNCVGHEHIGHGCIGHNYLGHNYIGHKYAGHNYIGHVYRELRFEVLDALAQRNKVTELARAITKQAKTIYGITCSYGLTTYAMTI